MKLCIFPNDPISSYFKKGEIKPRYFNPKNLFNEVHVISFVENDIESEKVQKIAGDAKLQIHSVGKISIKDRKKNVEKILEIVSGIEPDVIRAFNPRLEGWFAAKCSENLKIPLFVSLHTQFDHAMQLAKKSNLKRYLGLKYIEKFIAPYVLQNADKIIIVFKIIEPYVQKQGGKKPELLYNRIDIEQFSNGNKIESLPKPLIISVGNLIKEKNHECIIRAMKNVDAYCLIIGKGEHYENLINLIKKENLEEKIIIKDFVPHSEIQDYYKSADVFALAYDPELEGLPIPVIEAMASGLPVIIPNPKEDYSDGLEGIALYSNRNATSFAKNINKLLKNKEIHQSFSNKSVNKAKEFDYKILEKREAEIYSELVNDS